MSIVGPLSGGVEAFHRAESTVNEAASAIAQATTDREASESSFVKPLVSMQEAEVQAKAAAEVISAEDKMIGALLDVKA